MACRRAFGKDRKPMTEQLSSEKQTVILEAARKRFAYYGFSKVTMDEIAADIGMGKASLYYYFPTKESLFHEVVKQESDQFLRDIQSMLGEKIPACDMLRKYATKRSEYFKNLANLRALQFQQPAETRLTFVGLYNDFKQQEVNLLQQILVIGQKAGEFSISDTQHSAEIVIQMLYGPRAWLLHKRENTLDEETYQALEQSAKEIVEIILNGIRKRK